MSDGPQQDPSRNTPPPIQPLMELWSECLRQAESAADAVWGRAGGATAEEARRKWLDAVNRSLDEFMRSPAFLQSMKQQLDALIQSQARTRQSTSAAGIGAQLNQLEARILARLDRIDERLDSIEWELDSGNRTPSER